MSSIPVNDYGVPATLSVTAANASAAQTLAATAIGDIKTALTSLANGTSFSAPEAAGAVEFDEPSGENGVFSVSEAQLIVGAVTQGEAQSLAEAALAAIAGAVPGGATVTLEKGEGGAFVFQQLQ